MEEYDNFMRNTRNESNISTSHIQHQQPSDVNMNSTSSSFQYPFTQFHILSDECDKSTRCSDMFAELDGSGLNNLKSENLALLKELKLLKRELVLLHYGLTRQGFTRNIPIVINNNTEAYARCQTFNLDTKEEDSKIYSWINSFFSKPANRIIFILSLGLTGYMLQEKLKKTYLLSMIEERINRNPFLKTVYAFEEFFGLRTPPKLNFF